MPVQLSQPDSPGRMPQLVIKEEALIDILGPPMFEAQDDPKLRVTVPGIAIGLAANSMGGMWACCIDAGVHAPACPGRTEQLQQQWRVFVFVMCVMWCVCVVCVVCVMWCVCL